MVLPFIPVDICFGYDHRRECAYHSFGILLGVAKSSLDSQPYKEATMKKIVVAFAIAMALYTVSLASAQDKCTVSGEVVYSGDSNIYVCLLNSTTFATALGRQKELPPPGFVQIVKSNASGKASFEFKDIPKGEYVVRVFADENNNEKCDTDTWGFALEPVNA